MTLFYQSNRRFTPTFGWIQMRQASLHFLLIFPKQLRSIIIQEAVK
jgi:hypothetical protein